MHSEPNDRSVDAIIGALVSQCQEEVLDRYEVLLAQSGNALMSKAQEGEVRVHAAAVLHDVQSKLLNQQFPPSECEALSAAIGTTRAVQEVHPSESLRAAGLLFDATMSTVTRQLPQQSRFVPGVSRLAFVLHDATIDRVATAAVSYVAYLRERLHESHASERRRVARELHDLVAHSAAVVLQNLELFALHNERDPQRAAAKLDAALFGARDTLDMVRAVARDLRRSGVDDGLQSALASYRESLPMKPVVEISFRGDETHVPRAIRGELFLVLREAIRNAHTHADADRVLVDVDVGPYAIRACVTDDGRGFDLSTQSGGTGSASMRERIALLDGQIVVSSSPGHGTTVEIDVPLVGDPR